MEEDLIKSLQELDLSEKEAKTYVALIELGQTNVTRLSTFSKINRITTYHILNSLLEKGLATSTTKDGIQNFVAIKPRRLIEIIKQKEEKIRSIIPELEQKSEIIGKKPSLELYEGKKGVSALMDDLIDHAKGEILAYGNFDIVEKAMEYQSLHFRKTRIANQIRLKAITDQLNEDFTQNPSWKKLTEVRLLKKLANVSTWTFICEDWVAILTAKKELVGVVIKNEEIADSQKFIFENFWNVSRK